MGNVIINPATFKNPITLMGEMVGPSYGSDITDAEKNFQRGLSCIDAGHGRVLEFAEAYFYLEGYSARVIREFYTHVGGLPTRIQASTRYIDESNFYYYIPPLFLDNDDDDKAYLIYNEAMGHIYDAYQGLLKLGVSIEDAANILPLGMETTVSVRMNARTLISMAEQRLCSRAYYEYQDLMKDIILALKNYSEEWDILTTFMQCKCDKVGYCLEKKCCGKNLPKEEMALIPKKKHVELLNKAHAWDGIKQAFENKVD